MRPRHQQVSFPRPDACYDMPSSQDVTRLLLRGNEDDARQVLAVPERMRTKQEHDYGFLYDGALGRVASHEGRTGPYSTSREHAPLPPSPERRRASSSYSTSCCSTPSQPASCREFCSLTAATM